MLSLINSKFLPVIIGLIAVASLFFYISTLQKRVEQLDQTNKAIIADNARKKEVLNELIERDKTYQQITVKFDDKRQQNSQTYKNELREIENVKDEDDKSVGPVLTDYLNSLQ